MNIKKAILNTVTALMNIISLALTWRGLIRARMKPKAKFSVHSSWRLQSMRLPTRKTSVSLTTSLLHTPSHRVALSLSRLSAAELLLISGLMLLTTHQYLVPHPKQHSLLQKPARIIAKPQTAALQYRQARLR